MHPRHLRARLRRSRVLANEPCTNGAAGVRLVQGIAGAEALDITAVADREPHLVRKHEWVRLLPGDSAGRRGTAHAWSNRTSKLILIVAVMMSDTRSAISSVAWGAQADARGERVIGEGTCVVG